MKIQYLGTAAAEGWPALFCKCEACEKARKLGGKNIRTRSQSIVDDKLLIDIPADTYLHILNNKMDFSTLENILVTHSHEDHFYPLDIILKAPPYAHGGTKKLNVYGSGTIVKMLQETMDKSKIDRISDYVSPVAINPYRPFGLGEYIVTALRADHIPDEDCYIYIVEKDGKRLLYGHDTGVFPQETWEYLAGIRFDLVSLDCTFVLSSNERGHMGLPNASMVKEKMIGCGSADSDTIFVINHFSHNGNRTHDELSGCALQYGFLTSFDGMTVEF